MCTGACVRYITCLGTAQALFGVSRIRAKLTVLLLEEVLTGGWRKSELMINLMLLGGAGRGSSQMQWSAIWIKAEAGGLD